MKARHLIGMTFVGAAGAFAAGGTIAHFGGLVVVGAVLLVFGIAVHSLEDS